MQPPIDSNATMDGGPNLIGRVSIEGPGAACARKGSRGLPSIVPTSEKAR